MVSVFADAEAVSVFFASVADVSVCLYSDEDEDAVDYGEHHEWCDDDCGDVFAGHPAFLSDDVWSSSRLLDRNQPPQFWHCHRW